MKKQIFAALIAITILTSALFIEEGNAANQSSLTLQSTGTIINQTYQSSSSSPTPLTVILRGICITDLNPNAIDINSWVDSYVANHNYATAITISDMHQYGIWWYGYSFSQTNGTWMGWSFSQLKTLIDRFHYHGWKVGIETTGIAWNGQQEYKYITTQHPELAFTDANGLRATGVDNASASTKNPGYNKVIPDFFAKFASPDPTNNIPAGTRLIDLYTTRLKQMITDGLQWDFWYGTDGWNGFNIQGYRWNSASASSCYSFSSQEENEYGNWTGAILPLNWASMSQTQKATAIIGNQTILNNWWYYWQIGFAQMYAQIRQVFIDSQRPGPFYLVGTADESSEPGSGGNLAPAGMYNMSLLAKYNSVDYFYVDQEGVQHTGATYALARESAYVGALVKMQNPSLNPIIGLQLVDWLGNPYPLWEVEQSYLSQTVNYIWYNGLRYRVSSPNIIMMQYPDGTGWKGWNQEDVNALIKFIQTNSNLLGNATPIWLGPTYPVPDTTSGALGAVWCGLNYSIAQWAWTTNLQNNPNSIKPNMGTMLLDEALGDSGPQLKGLYNTMVNQLWANNSLNLWYWEVRAMDWGISSIWGSNELDAQNAFHITYSPGNTANYTIISDTFGNNGATYVVDSQANVGEAHGMYTAKPGFTNIANFTYDKTNTIAIGYYENSTTSNFLLTHMPNGRGPQNYRQIVPRSMINQMLYWVSECPVNSSEPLIDLKIENASGTILLPMTNQKDIGDSKGPSSGWTISSTLTFDTAKLGLGNPSNYKVYWASNSTPISVSDWSNVQINLQGMADALVIQPIT